MEKDERLSERDDLGWNWVKMVRK